LQFSTFLIRQIVTVVVLIEQLGVMTRIDDEKKNRKDSWPPNCLESPIFNLAYQTAGMTEAFIQTPLCENKYKLICWFKYYGCIVYRSVQLVI